MKKYKHIFFDLDGTLWDIHRNTREALDQMFREFDLDQNSFESFYRRYIYHNEKVWALYRVGKIEKEELRTIRFERAFSDVGLNTPSSEIEIFASRFLEVCPQMPHLLEGTHTLLSRWKTQATLHIITNGFQEVQGFKLEAGKLYPYFDQIINSEDAGYRKPHKGIFEYALQQAGASGEHSLMIGDDWDADIIGARDFGMDQVFITATEKMQMSVTGETHKIRHNYTPTYTVDSLTELLPLLDH